MNEMNVMSDTNVMSEMNVMYKSDVAFKELLRRIQEVEFAAVELNLYLDTHPDNVAALNDYNRIAVELSKLKKEYRMNYGPLANFGYGTSGHPWQWIESPWPWEV